MVAVTQLSDYHGGGNVPVNPMVRILHRIKSLFQFSRVSPGFIHEAVTRVSDELENGPALTKQGAVADKPQPK